MISLLLILSASDIVQYNTDCIPGLTDLVYLKNGLKNDYNEMKSTMGPMQTFVYYDKDGNVQTGGMWTIQQITKGDNTQRIAFVKTLSTFDITNPNVEQEYIIKPVTVPQNLCGYDGFMAWMHKTTPIMTWDAVKQKYIAHVIYVDRMGNIAYLRISEGENVVVKTSCNWQIKNPTNFILPAKPMIGWEWEDFVFHTFVRPGEAHPESKEGFIVYRAQTECIPSKEAAKSLPLVTFDLASATFSIFYVEQFLMRRTKTKDMAQYSFGVDPKTKNAVLVTTEPTGSRDEYYYTSIPLNHQIWINSVIKNPPELREFTSTYKDLQQKRNKVSYPRIKSSNSKAAKNLWVAVEAQERMFGLFAGYASARRLPYNTYGPAFVVDGKVSVPPQLYNKGPYDYANTFVYFINSSQYGIRMIPYSPSETEDVTYQTPYADILILNLEQFTDQTNKTYSMTVDQVGKSNLMYFPGPTLIDKDGNPTINSQMMQYGLGNCAMDKFTLLIRLKDPKISKNKVAYKGYFGKTYNKGSEPSFTIDDQKDPDEDYVQIPEVPTVQPENPTVAFPPIPTSIPVATPVGNPGEPQHYCLCDAPENQCYSYGCSENDIISFSGDYARKLDSLETQKVYCSIFTRVSSVSKSSDSIDLSQLSHIHTLL